MRYIEDYDITPTALAVAVRELAAAHPDRRAVSQYATDDGEQPCCIVGTALFNLGVPIEQLLEWDEDPTGAGCSVDSITQNDFAGDLVWLADVQASQDASHPWGQAVLWADAVSDDY